MSDEVAIYSRRCSHWQTRFNGEPFVALSCTWHLSNWVQTAIACWTVQGPGVAAPTRSRIFAIRFSTSSVTDALFTGRARLVGAWLIDWPYIDGAKFGEGIDFLKANFVVLSASFVGARVASSVELGNFWPDRWTTRPAKPGNKEDPTFCYLMRVEDGPPPST